MAVALPGPLRRIRGLLLGLLLKPAAVCCSSSSAIVVEINTADVLRLESPAGSALNLHRITQISSTGGFVEGGFSVKLKRMPASAVTIGLSVVSTLHNPVPDLSSQQLVFEPATWAKPQTVTVTATNDGVFSSYGWKHASIVPTCSSSDSSFTSCEPICAR